MHSLTKSLKNSVLLCIKLRYSTSLDPSYLKFANSVNIENPTPTVMPDFLSKVNGEAVYLKVGMLILNFCLH